VLDPGVPVPGFGRPGDRLLELFEGGGQFAAGELSRRHEGFFAPLHVTAGV